MKFILPKIFLGIERWKWNKEYRVYVSNMGHFKDEHKEDLPFKTTNSGYLNVKTRCGYKLAHRLVMLTWRPIPGAEDLTVDHLDHNKRNNALTNLEWVTREENLRRADEDYLDNEMAELPIPTVQVTVKKKKKNNKIERGTNQHFKTPADAAKWAMTLPELANNKTVKVETVKKNVKKAAKNKTSYLGFMWEIDSVTQSENQKKKNAEAKAKAAADEIVVTVTLDPEEEEVEVIVEIDEDEEIEYVEVVITYNDEFVSFDTSKSMFYIQSNAPPN